MKTLLILTLFLTSISTQTCNKPVFSIGNVVTVFSKDTILISKSNNRLNSTKYSVLKLLKNKSIIKFRINNKKYLLEVKNITIGPNYYDNSFDSLLIEYKITSLKLNRFVTIRVLSRVVNENTSLSTTALLNKETYRFLTRSTSQTIFALENYILENVDFPVTLTSCLI